MESINFYYISSFFNLFFQGKLKVWIFFWWRVENLEKFARDLVAGNLVPYLKSEPVPTENPDAVKVRLTKLEL